MPWTLQGTRSGYEKLWRSAVVTSGKIKTAASYIVAHRAQYEEIQKLTGVPWEWIGAVHYRESSGNFKTHLHNGDPLTRRTYHVPAGRPKSGSPPFSFVASAVDALRLKGLDKVKSWGIAERLFYMEVYNGLGYIGHKRNSPYLWAGTNLQQRGKYIADGKFSYGTWDTQPGTAAILKEVYKLVPEAEPRSKNPIGTLATGAAATPIAVAVTDDTSLLLVAATGTVLVAFWYLTQTEKGSSMLKNWKTTLTGIAAALTAAAALVNALASGDFSVVSIATEVGTILAGLGLVAARDATSKSALTSKAEELEAKLQALQK